MFDTFTWTFSLLTVCPKEPIPLSGSGTFSSPNYPKSNYSAFTNCTWIITAPDGKYVKLIFTDFALSSCAPNCSSDYCSYVELYDGGSANSSLLGRFCQGSTRPKETFSSSHQMFVKFHSGNTVDRGFKAKYSVESTPPTTRPSTNGKWPEICSVPTYALFWLSRLNRWILGGNPHYIMTTGAKQENNQQIHPFSLCQSSQSPSEHCQITPIQSDRSKQRFVYRSHELPPRFSDV